MKFAVVIPYVDTVSLEPYNWLGTVEAPSLGHAYQFVNALCRDEVRLLKLIEQFEEFDEALEPSTSKGRLLEKYEWGVGSPTVWPVDDLPALEEAIDAKVELVLDRPYGAGELAIYIDAPPAVVYRDVSCGRLVPTWDGGRMTFSPEEITDWIAIDDVRAWMLDEHDFTASIVAYLDDVTAGGTRQTVVSLVRVAEALGIPLEGVASAAPKAVEWVATRPVFRHEVRRLELREGALVAGPTLTTGESPLTATPVGHRLAA